MKDNLKKGKNVGRMMRKDEVAFLIYPENRLKSKWDIFMTLVLILSCLTTPFLLAFTPEPKS